MHWTIYIDREVNCAFGKYYGVFDIGRLEIAAEEMFNHPEYRAGMNSLRDARELTMPTSKLSFGYYADKAREVMNEFDSKLGECKWAIVAGDGQNYARAHQYLVAGRLGKSQVERKAFRDMEKAMDWLGLPEGYEIKYPTQDETT